MVPTVPRVNPAKARGTTEGKSTKAKGMKEASFSNERKRDDDSLRAVEKNSLCPHLEVGVRTPGGLDVAYARARGTAAEVTERNMVEEERGSWRIRKGKGKRREAGLIWPIEITTSIHVDFCKVRSELISKQFSRFGH